MTIAVTLASRPGSLVAAATKELFDLGFQRRLQDHACALSGSSVDASLGDQARIVVLTNRGVSSGEFQDLAIRLHALPPVLG